MKSVHLFIDTQNPGLASQTALFGRSIDLEMRKETACDYIFQNERKSLIK